MEAAGPPKSQWSFALLRELVSDMTGRIKTKCLANKLLTLILAGEGGSDRNLEKTATVKLHTCKRSNDFYLNLKNMR
jgi:hypothetical protein